MAPRVGFEPTTNRLTVDCSTTELPRNIRHASKRDAGRFLSSSAPGGKTRRASLFRPLHHPERKTRAPCGALEGVGYGGVSPREDKVNFPLTGKGNVNAQDFIHEACESVEFAVENSGGLARNRTGVQGFAVLCVATPPRGLIRRADLGASGRLS